MSKLIINKTEEIVEKNREEIEWLLGSAIRIDFGKNQMVAPDCATNFRFKKIEEDGEVVGYEAIDGFPGAETTHDINIALMSMDNETIIGVINDKVVTPQTLYMCYLVGLMSGGTSALRDYSVGTEEIITNANQDKIHRVKYLHEEQEQYTTFGRFKGTKFIRGHKLETASAYDLYWAGYYTRLNSHVEDYLRDWRELKENNTKRLSLPESDNPRDLSIQEIALLHVYKGLVVTKENANKIIKDFGHKSGEALYGWYVKVSSRSYRRGKPVGSTPRKLRNKIDRIEKVIFLLSEEERKTAKDDANRLRFLLENDPYC